MNNITKKAYVAPTVATLGSLAEITEAGDRPNADTHRGQDGTAFKPGS